MIHDHYSWSAYTCAIGTVLEERYDRLDDGSTIMPGDGGIHRVGNPCDEPAVSVHLYGPRVSEVDGRDYDPSRDYVCDRTEG